MRGCPLQMYIFQNLQYYRHACFMQWMTRLAEVRYQAENELPSKEEVTLCIPWGQIQLLHSTYIFHTHTEAINIHVHTQDPQTCSCCLEMLERWGCHSQAQSVLRLQAPGHLGRAQEVNWHLASYQSTLHSDWSAPDFNWPPFVSQAKSPEAELLLPKAPSHSQCNNLCDFSTPECAMSVLRRAWKNVLLYLFVRSITHRMIRMMADFLYCLWCGYLKAQEWAPNHGNKVSIEKHVTQPSISHTKLLPRTLGVDTLNLTNRVKIPSPGDLKSH